MQVVYSSSLFMHPADIEKNVHAFGVVLLAPQQIYINK